MTAQTELAPKPSARRIEVIDIARGVALVAMAIYHFTWDLEFFGYLDPGTTAFGGWKIFARCIASSFLLLVGVGLFLGHGRGIRWNGFWRRFAMIAIAAAAITLVTWLAVPGGLIFFGILHQIALASLLGLAFLRLPALLTLLVAAFLIAGSYYLQADAFNHPALWWVGLSTASPRSNDYVPLFPWFGAVLIGIALAKLATSFGILERLAQINPPRVTRLLGFAGRHSLAFYLIHQPLLIACVWLYSQVLPAPVETREVGFLKSCQVSCEANRDTEFCSRYCVCMLDALEAENALDRLYEGTSPELDAHVGELVNMCSAKIDSADIEGGVQ